MVVYANVKRIQNGVEREEIRRSFLNEVIKRETSIRRWHLR